jgi:hypothetical protein
MAAYGQTDYEKGVLYGLAHDVPVLRVALEKAFASAHSDINKGPSHFTDGRRYPLVRLQDVIAQTMSALENEARQDD